MIEFLFIAFLVIAILVGVIAYGLEQIGKELDETRVYLYKLENEVAHLHGQVAQIQRTLADVQSVQEIITNATNEKTRIAGGE